MLESFNNLSLEQEMDCKNQTFKLLSGRSMPLIGFGTFRINGRQLIRDVLDWSFSAGYRSIDTAAVYGNEQDIGRALKELLPKHKLKREDIFITSKLSPSEHGEKARGAVANSLKNLQCDYLDLYLIHWPGAAGITVTNPLNGSLRALSWTGLIQARNEGLVRDIGVSNYTVRHLEELLAEPQGVKPVVNQVEWHPSCHQSDLKELCQKEGILLQAYQSLGGTGNKSLLDDPLVVGVSQKLDRSPAQVLLRWAFQQNIGILPKARSRERIQANIDLNFTIPEEDMSALGRREIKKFAWNPISIQ